jgi:hypothetical protein
MTLQVVFWLVLGGWAVAAVLVLIQLAYDALAADARDARPAARSLLAGLRNPVRFGVIATSVVVFSAIFRAINETWNLSFRLFSYDLTAYSGSVKEVALIAGVWICSAIVFTFVDRLLDRLLPNDAADRTLTADRQVANGHNG